MAVESPRLLIEREARKAIEAILKERPQHVARLVELDREQQQMTDVLTALGTTYHFEEAEPS